MYNPLMLLVWLALMSTGQGQSKTVPKARIAALSRGIHVEGDTVQSDLDQIRELGFTNVEASDAKIANSALAAELSVTIDADLIPKLGFVDWDRVFVWTRSAEEYAQARGLYPAATIVYESNLPVGSNLGNTVVKRTFAISKSFILQGLKGFEDVRSLLYPSNPADVTRALAEADDLHKDEVYQYGKERWNRDRLKRVLEAEFKTLQGANVPIIVSGLSVSGRAPSESRTRYVSDLVSVLKELRCGWQVDSYREPFGPFKGSPGSRKIDEAWLSAVGLAGQ
jgi:hypothetical protein